MRYFFDIATDFKSITPERAQWWRRFADWKDTPQLDAEPQPYAKALGSTSFEVRVTPTLVTIHAPIEDGVEAETFDAILELVHHYVQEFDALPVGFTYATLAHGVDGAGRYRQYGGGYVFITKNKIHEEAACDRLIEIQERLAKNGEL